MCRPQFSDIYGVKDARHPLLEKFCGHDVTPNDVVSF